MDLTFEILVESKKSKEDLIEYLNNQFPDSLVRGGYLLLQGNVLKIEENPGHDKNRLGFGEESWSFFKYSASVFPQNTSDIKNQKTLARQLLDVLRATAEDVELIAEPDFYE
ncbi:hypothetical protein QMO14_21520 [Variovorax sp. CAN2819]|uniref:hypothetical protein n=1 Tax=Variovorax sp. CAN15 TaxID=3046727 RepID=UPI002647DA60|nr:hypothetical protein [Variovorax sp. CAN15]MDN6886174.1 hypothetical protein [Variovorax sp. CAN15]